MPSGPTPIDPGEGDGDLVHDPWIGSEPSAHVFLSTTHSDPAAVPVVGSCEQVCANCAKGPPLAKHLWTP